MGKMTGNFTGMTFEEIKTIFYQLGRSKRIYHGFGRLSMEKKIIYRFLK